MNSPDVVGATVVERSPDGLVVLLDDGTRRTIPADRAPGGALRAGQRLQVGLTGDDAQAIWPRFSVTVTPRS
ncbi:hypothetical protein EDD41_3199 [Luteococcus japonicus]|uniref:Uncharacterized protein n=1 Tax=Luteococcus japonicus TaxID=33984 RepID=A0A3N1ZYU3_9ACTN|nr:MULTISPECIES: hypothetical protein [Luteococcus]MDN5562342.1 hypothetical protein [Luteococcus sp.]ROR55908.1 hypothetical protein EDD41_3199 [Luteococcus japonicus]